MKSNHRHVGGREKLITVVCKGPPSCANRSSNAILQTNSGVFSHKKKGVILLFCAFCVKTSVEGENKGSKIYKYIYMT